MTQKTLPAPEPVQRPPELLLRLRGARRLVELVTGEPWEVSAPENPPAQLTPTMTPRNSPRGGGFPSAENSSLANPRNF